MSEHPHGSAYDRGMADSYYGRAPHPHKGGVGGESGPRVERDGLSMAEIDDYLLGYAENELNGDKKDWG